MKYSVVTSAPLRALFLGACLLAPQAVQSEKFFLDDILAPLAPGIDRMNFHRSLEMDPFFYELLDDDTVLDYLSGIDLDETLVQCMKDVDTFYNETPGIRDAIQNFSMNATNSTDFKDKSTLAVTVEYPEESRQILRQKCAGEGGHFEIMTGELLCSKSDPDAGLTIERTISGFATCMANTMSCTSPGRMISIEFSVLHMKSQGIACELLDSSTALDSAGGMSAPSSLAFAGLLVAAISFLQM